MRKISLFFLIVGILIISSCTSLSNLENKKKDLAIKKSYIVADAYIDTCKIYTQALLAIDLSLLQTDLSDNSDLKQMRNKIDSSIVNIRNYLMSVKQYKSLIEYGEKNGTRTREYSRAQRFIMDSLSRASDEYLELRKTSISLIKENNLKIITLIVEDYKQRGEEIPVTWIPKMFLGRINQISKIKRIDKKTERIDKTILKKFGNKNGIVTINLMRINRTENSSIS
jgi:hypothetical protein